MNWDIFFSKRIKIFGFFIFAFFVFYNLVVSGNFLTKNNVIDISNIATGDIILSNDKTQIQKDDKYIILGFSLNCHHCREFILSNLSKFRKQFDNKNNNKKTYIVLRLLPDSKFSLKVFAFLNCLNSSEEKLAIIKIIIENFQEITSAQQQEDMLLQILKKNHINIESNFYFKCLNNQQIQKQGIDNVQKTIKNGIKSVPFLINNAKLVEINDLNKYLD